MSSFWFSSSVTPDYNLSKNECSQISRRQGIIPLAYEGPNIHPDIEFYTHGECPRPLIPRVLDFNVSSVTERACIDTYSKGSTQFCKLYMLSGDSNELMISRQQEPENQSPSKPFFLNPRLGIDTILKTVFRGKGQLTSGPSLKEGVFTSWVVCPSEANHGALAFTAGHAFTKQRMGLTHADTTSFDFGDNNFSNLIGCFGRDVGQLGFAQCGFNCSPQPLALVNDGEEDLALFSISNEKSIMNFLLPCSPELECTDNQKFMATFTYPCTQTFLMRAYEELIEGERDHGIMDLYKFLSLEKAQLYNLLWQTFGAFHDGLLVCSPGAIENVDSFHCFYKCSTVGGSSGGPVVPTHLPGYSIGNHNGTLPHQDYNIATSTDSPAFVTMYSHYVLPRLPSRDSKFWFGYNLVPFERWLQKHHLVWRAEKNSTWAGEVWQRLKAGKIINGMLMKSGWDTPGKKEKLKWQLEVVTPPTVT